MTKTRTDGVFFLEFGFVGKQKGNEKQQNKWEFFFSFFFWNLVLLKNRSRSRVLVLLETNGKGNSRESRVQKLGSKVAAPSPMLG